MKTEEEVAVRIGHCAAAEVCLDDPGYLASMGITESNTNKRTTTYTAPIAFWRSCADEFEWRSRDEGIDTDPAARAACRRACRTIRKAIHASETYAAESRAACDNIAKTLGRLLS